MATVNLSVTIPDAQLPRVQAAARGTFGQIEDPPGSGIFRDMTNAEVVERMRQETIAMIKGMTLRYERRQLQITAEGTIATVDAT